MRKSPGHSQEVWELLSLLVDEYGDETEAHLRDELERAEDEDSRTAWVELLMALEELRARS